MAKLTHQGAFTGTQSIMLKRQTAPRYLRGGGRNSSWRRDSASQGVGNVIANEAPRMKDVCQIGGDHKHRTMTIRSKGAQQQAEMKLVSTTCNFWSSSWKFSQTTPPLIFYFYYYLGPIFLLNFFPILIYTFFFCLLYPYP